MAQPLEGVPSLSPSSPCHNSAFSLSVPLEGIQEVIDPWGTRSCKLQVSLGLILVSAQSLVLILMEETLPFWWLLPARGLGTMIFRDCHLVCVLPEVCVSTDCQGGGWTSDLLSWEAEAMDPEPTHPSIQCVGSRGNGEDACWAEGGHSFPKQGPGQPHLPLQPSPNPELAHVKPDWHSYFNKYSYLLAKQMDVLSGP